MQTLIVCNECARPTRSHDPDDVFDCIIEATGQPIHLGWTWTPNGWLCPKHAEEFLGPLADRPGRDGNLVRPFSI